jgi:superfamily II DNA helicase RecQ
MGEDKDEKFWNMVIRQALIAKLLAKDIENYGLLKLTQKGMEFLKNPTSFMLAEDHDYADTTDEENAFGARTATVDEELFSILKDLRKTSFCYIPGPVARGHGDSVPHNHRRASEYFRRRSRESPEIRKRIC